MTCFWRHAFIFEVTYFLLYGKLLVFMTFLVSWCVLTSWWTFWRHDAFDVITNFLLIAWCTFRNFDVMTCFLTLWHIFWRHYVLSIFLDLMTCFLIYFLTFWCTFRRYNVLLMHWRTYGHYSVHFGVITYFLQSWRTSWRHDLLYWCHDILLMSHTFWHIPFQPNSLKNLDPGLFCCFLRATYCTCALLTYSYLMDCEVHLTKWNDLGPLFSGQNHTSTHDEHTYGHWFCMTLHLLITNSSNQGCLI